MSLNKIILMGRLTKDPELRYTPSNVPVCSFDLAVDRDRIDKQSGERETDFFEVTCWRGVAEFASKYLSKGVRVAVDGRLQMRDWTDKNGIKRRSAEVVADNVYFADAKREDAAPGRTYPQNAPAFEGLDETNERHPF